MDKDHAHIIPISKILDKLQIAPEHVGQGKALYRSPLSRENSKTFWIYLDANLWYDHAIQAGGDLEEFARRFLKFTGESYTPVDVHRWINNLAEGLQQVTTSQDCHLVNDSHTQNKLIVRSVSPIRFEGLVKYLENECISVELAKLYAKEVKLKDLETGRNIIALGVKNENEGYHLYNPYLNSSTYPPGISFFRGKGYFPDRIHVFNSMFDYLSVLAQLKSQRWKHDTIVLHSHSNISQIIPYIQNYGYQAVCSWFENDKSGQDSLATLQSFVRDQPGMIHLKMNKHYHGQKNIHAWFKAHVASQR